MAVLFVRNGPQNAGLLQTMELTAKPLKLALQTFVVGGPADFDGAFACHAFACHLTPPSPLVYHDGDRGGALRRI